MTEPVSRREDSDSALAFGDSAREFLRARSPLSRLRSLRAGSPRFDRAVWASLTEAGWTSILAPEELGGLGLDLRHACAVAEEVGRHPMPEPVLGAAIQTVSLLAALPRGEQRDVLLASVMSGELVAGTAWQERAGQLEPEESLATRAVRCDDAYKLEGSKRWVVPGVGADGWLVSAATGADAAIWWVPASTRGVSASEEDRIDGSTCATLRLEQVELPASLRLATGEDALAALRRANDATRMAQAAELLGIARESFAMTLGYLRTRVQFGKPIGSNQALQHRMVDAYIQIELASACLREAIAEGEASARRLAAAASRAKARCVQAALMATRLGLQLHGAIGFTDEYDLGLYLKRALQHASWLGSESAMRLRYQEEAVTPVEASTATDGTSEDRIAPRDTDWAGMGEAQFRRMVRSFLRYHYPDNLRHPSHRLHWDECKAWYQTLSKQGWLAPAWPREHGGMGLPGDKLLAFIEEMEDYGVARLPDQGIINLGPVLIRFGTPEQQREYLPKILSGEHIWCQGYSEPNAGSDLASLRTEAIADGDEFIVNGQKIWTTLAQDATHIFCLVRTDRAGRKQEGISFLLVNLSSPGVSIRPIRSIAGEEEFCEVFFDNVRVPMTNLVGELHGGWRIAKALLGFERLFVGSPKTAQYAMSLLRKVAQARGLLENEAFLERYAQLDLDVADLKAAYGQFAEMIKRGSELPASVSILKIWASETYTAITRFMFEACDELGGAVGDVDLGGGAVVNVSAPLMNATITTIYAGSNEIQRNILTKAVLELPS
ncbi:MAG: acyl-CoA dehydrogenase [Betaproteobacteria bacterium]|nr:acyl-CoA dehydrogenase [Betaproteobacteria bacterium]